ncbi:hypothetical protein C1Y40_03428 [Mycobacterium talmoniae]|uniref:Uncharacterized protein n=1 Tax=Mycobacterium talmoniae TaxID=1858794 RepID=A0A2S8BIG1_9MYCO|nr:hypothetical protein C1Y40_03428 [Mycobacterium talmoniae]
MGGVKPAVLQGLWPVLTQIHRHRNQVRGGVGALTPQCGGLEVQHFGLVQLVDRGAIRPRQPPGPGIQTGCQDHDLPHPGLGGGKKHLIEEHRAHRHEVDHGLRLGPHLGVDVVGQRRRDVDAPDALAGGVEERPRERVTDQRVFALGLRGTGGGHAQRRRAHAFGDVPGVVIGSRHGSHGTAAACEAAWCAPPCASRLNSRRRVLALSLHRCNLAVPARGSDCPNNYRRSTDVARCPFLAGFPSRRPAEPSTAPRTHACVKCL